MLESNEAGWLSVALPDERRKLRRVLSSLPAGVAHLARDPRPPSRAYQKLLEAELRLGRPIGRGETVVDLGASPGGWSFVALERGARVDAVDRSPLREDLMRHPLLRFHKGDAFAWEPTAPVDWLICDLIAFPERTLELLDRWLARGWCKRFCVTMKFRGTEDYGRVDELKALLAKRAGDFAVRQLDANKNEVTAMGEARSEPRAILFDMDGVLVKSWEVWYRVVAEAGVRFRGREISREEFAPTFGQGTAADIPAFGLSCTVAELDRYYADNFMRHAEAMWVNPEAAPLLDALAKRGFRLAVVTNTVTSLTRDILTHAKLLAALRLRGLRGPGGPGQAGPGHRPARLRAPGRAPRGELDDRRLALRPGLSPDGRRPLHRPGPRGRRPHRAPARAGELPLPRPLSQRARGE